MGSLGGCSHERPRRGAPRGPGSARPSSSCGCGQALGLLAPLPCVACRGLFLGFDWRPSRLQVPSLRLPPSAQLLCARKWRPCCWGLSRRSSTHPAPRGSDSSHLSIQPQGTRCQPGGGGAASGPSLDHAAGEKRSIKTCSQRTCPGTWGMHQSQDPGCSKRGFWL